MHAIVLSIGDELVLGQTVDSNTAYLSARLARMGIPTLLHHTVADDFDIIVETIRDAAKRADLVLITGGLGPTEDDLTREAIAKAMGVGQSLHDESLRRLEDFFQKRGKKMPERNRVQAMLPDTAEAVPNHHGTAPGVKAKVHNAIVYAMPGVPREMIRMFEDRIEPDIRAFAGRGVILTTKINTFGSGESDVGEKLGRLMQRDRNPKVGTTVAQGICSVRVRSEFDTEEQAQQQLDDTAREVEHVLGPIVFGRDDTTLPEAVVHLLAEKSQCVAVAESCTGGLFGGALTEISGASEVFAGGVITYSDTLKRDLLGVDEQVLQQHGAVSAEVARAMARGVVERVGGDMGISITGIAGPGGGTQDKPVGTVFIALASRHAPAESEPPVLRLQLGGSRFAIRDRTVKSALQMLRLYTLNQPLEAVTWGELLPTPTPTT
ncbi:MAG: competence/damage-inducible protein A [Phycisphaeraceae bacterium]